MTYKKLLIKTAIFLAYTTCIMIITACQSTLDTALVDSDHQEIAWGDTFEFKKMRIHNVGDPMLIEYPLIVNGYPNIEHGFTELRIRLLNGQAMVVAGNYTNVKLDSSKLYAYELLEVKGIRFHGVRGNQQTSKIEISNKSKYSILQSNHLHDRNYIIVRIFDDSKEYLNSSICKTHRCVMERAIAVREENLNRRLPPKTLNNINDGYERDWTDSSRGDVKCVCPKCRKYSDK